MMSDEAKFCAKCGKSMAKGIESQFSAYLRKTISLRDTFVRKERKETFHGVEAITKGSKKQNPSACFYHGILLGILGTKESWAVSSNSEAGDGYSDIQIEIVDEELGIIIEVKYADNGDLDAACQEALDQIEKMHYDENLKDDGIDHILKYGIACYKKRCRVMLADN